MGFVLSPLPRRLSGFPKRRSRTSRYHVTLSATAKSNRVKRTRITGTDVSGLSKLARETENSTDGIRVLALRGRSKCEMIEVGGDDGPLHIVWPLSAPAWPFNASFPSDDDPDVENAPALLATTRLDSSEKAQIVLSRLRGHLRTGLDSGEIFAGVVLVDGMDPSVVHVLSVHDPDEGVLFDSDLAGADWSVSRYSVVHPPLSQWRSASNAVSLTVDDFAHTINVKSRCPPSSENEKIPMPSVKIAGDPDIHIPEGPGELAKEADFAPKTRILFGSGSIDGIVIRMREVGKVKDGEPLELFVVSGWNEARIQPLTVECETPHENGFLKMIVGSNIFAGYVTICKIREALVKYREQNAHVVAGFGGGSVMDATKAIAALAAQRPVVAEDALEEIEAAARRGQREASITLPRKPLPAVLINGTIGTGASLSDSILFTVESKDSHFRSIRHSIFVTFNYGSDVKRSERERMAVVDSRIVSPRRLNGQDAAQGGLLALCCALDSVFSSRAAPQTTQLAMDALHHGADYLLQARRDPTHSDGQSRDFLLRSSCGAALARDAAGSPPLGLMMTAALMDALVDGPYDGAFRWIYSRVMVAIVRKCCSVIAVDDVLMKAAQITLHDDTVAGPNLVAWLLDYAERFGVPQARMIGLTKKRAHQAAISLANSRAVRTPPHPIFDEVETLIELVDDVLDSQPFEL